MNKIAALFLGSMILLQCTAMAYDTSADAIREKQLAFAMQYDYHEGDMEKSFAEYPGIAYTAGIEYRADGTEYECPAIYVDTHAMAVNDYKLTKESGITITMDGRESQANGTCILYNGRTLVPLEIFREAGCAAEFNEDTYVAAVSDGETVLEILPNLIGMRKNKADGFYVPLEVCARFASDVLYVPLRAVAEELNIRVQWDQAQKTVSLFKD